MASRGKHAQLNQMYVADFETCDSDRLYKVDNNGKEIYYQRVWLAGYKNLEDMETIHFTNLDDFMRSILSRGRNVNTEYAFHNIRFDGSFIVPWLFDNGYTVTHNKPKAKEFSILIDERNNWYTIQIQVTAKRKVTLWDSAKLFPTQLEYLHETYGTPTKKLHEDEEFYSRVRDKNHKPTLEEMMYFENDLQVLAETLNEHIKFYGLLFKKTQASQSFYNFEKHFKAWKLRFPPLEDEVDEAIRGAYWGGISWTNKKYRGKDVYNIDVYDINSSYPYQLAFRKLPYGRPIRKYGQGVHPDMSKFWVGEVLIKFKLKKDKLPCIPTKAIVEGKPITNDKWLTDSFGIVRMLLCNIDYLTIKESYDFEIISWEWSIHFTWKIQKEIQSFILKNNDDKVNYKRMANNEKCEDLKREYLSRSQRAKIDNNSFYGKFGETIIKLGKTPYKEDDEIIYRVDKEEVLREGKRKYLPVAIATTAWGRYHLVKLANAVGEKFLYCDTDSIHILREGSSVVNMLSRSGEIKLDKLELGAWDMEGQFDRGRYLRPKCYYEEKYGETPEVTLAGLPADPHTGARSKQRTCCTWDNFHIGLNIPDGNGRLQSVRTPTGIKLMSTDFTITEHHTIFG